MAQIIDPYQAIEKNKRMSSRVKDKFKDSMLTRVSENPF